jgi:hypothetical protein
LRRADADIVRFTGTVFVPAAACDPFLTLAHRARCAAAIRALPAADIVRPGRVPLREAPVPFRPTNPSITEIADCNCSICCSACLCSWRSCWSALLRLDIVYPHYLDSVMILDGREDCWLLKSPQPRNVAEDFRSDGQLCREFCWRVSEDHRRSLRFQCQARDSGSTM